MDDMLNKLMQEEISEYKKELRQYLEEIPDSLFYQYFEILPMSEGDYEQLRQDLLRRKYYCLLARFLERRNGVRESRKRNSGKIEGPVID